MSTSWNETCRKRPDRTALVFGLFTGLLIFLYVTTTGDWTIDKGVVQARSSDKPISDSPKSLKSKDAEVKSDRSCDSASSARLYPEENPHSDRIVEQLEYRPCRNSSKPLTILVWGGVANWGGIRPKNGNEVLFNILKSILKLIWSRCSRGRSARCRTAGSPQTGRSWTRQIWSSSGWEVYLIISSVVNYKRENLQGGKLVNGKIFRVGN